MIIPCPSPPIRCTTRYPLGIAGFAGHLGLLLQDEALTRWYPLSIHESDRIGEVLTLPADVAPRWMNVATLNNRMLVFRLSALKQLTLLAEAATPPDDRDWVLGWDGHTGLAPEIYRALAERLDDDDTDHLTRNSDALRAAVEHLVTVHALDDDAIRASVTLTHIHFTDGASTSREVCANDLAELF